MADTPPEAEEQAPAAASADDTLAGYLEIHDRPPAFEGPDGHPYTVSMEVERTGDLRAPWEGYLVFPRWAATGLGIVGHVETSTLTRNRSSDEARDVLGRLTLLDVKRLLDAAVAARGADSAPSP
jgi:hypothetical protein